MKISEIIAKVEAYHGPLEEAEQDAPHTGLEHRSGPRSGPGRKTHVESLANVSCSCRNQAYYKRQLFCLRKGFSKICVNYTTECKESVK